MSVNDRALNALKELLEVIEHPPEPNCSCHISPPCADCVDYSGLREAIAEAESVLRIGSQPADLTDLPFGGAK